MVAGLALLTAAVDQLIKGLVLATLPGKSHVIVPGLLRLVYRENRGVAFSFLDGIPVPVLLLVNLAVLAIFLWLVRPYLSRGLGRLCAVLVLGGALGNLYDRLVRHFVIDYLDFRIWPVFNLADACVVAGVGVLVVLLLRHTPAGAGGGAASAGAAGDGSATSAAAPPGGNAA